LPKAHWRFVSLADARRALDVLVAHDMRYLVITGGEPLLHPDIYEILTYAHALDMTTLMVTNGSRLNQQRIAQLKASGLHTLFISIDAADAQRHEKNRKLNNVCARIEKANGELARVGIQSTASVTMSRLIDDYAQLPGFLKSLGFDNVTFSYPLTTLNSSFLGAAESDLVSYRDEELLAAFEQIKALKSAFRVLNPTVSINEMQRFIRGERQRFACLGGHKYFYLDWDCYLWRCHYWEEPLCHVFDFNETYRVRDGCTRCMIDCYRDASVMQHVAVSSADALAQARSGHWLEAARSLFNRNNFDSVRAVTENIRWISRN
jgi:MoaA/NifB/PqqE/SkfB family radical SAM enzyme